MTGFRRSALAPFGAAALALAAVLAGCGGGSSGSNAAGTTQGAAREESAASERGSGATGPTKAILHPLGDSGVTGTVLFVKQAQTGFPLLKVRLRGVRRATGETQYALWQLGSRRNMVSLATYHVPHGSTLSEELEANPEVVQFLEDGSTTEMLITKVPNDDYLFKTEERATDATDPPYIGQPVARGAYRGPLVGSTAE